MISLNANSLFGATNAQSLKKAIDRHVDQAVEERFKQTSKAGQGRSREEIYERLMSAGISSNGFSDAIKSAARADELSKYMNQARSEMDRRAAAEKLDQSKRRMGELESEAREAAAKGNVSKLARIAREASSMTRSLADEAKGLVNGKDVSPAERAAAIAAGKPDPATPIEPQPGMTAGGVPVSFARAYVQEVRDVAGRARTLLTQAEANKDSGLWMTEEEKKELEELLKQSRDDLAAASDTLESLNGTLEAQDPGGVATDITDGGGATATAAQVTYTYTQTETITIAMVSTEASVSVTA